MSTSLGKNRYVFNTAIGPIVTETELITNFDVEDIVRSMAVDYAKKVKIASLVNLLDGVSSKETPAALSNKITLLED